MSKHVMKDTLNLTTYTEILELQRALNLKLQDAYSSNQTQGRAHLSQFLINYVEKLVNALNVKGFNFVCCSYCGDVDFENSEQTYSSGKEMGKGIILHFHGYSVQAIWEGSDKYPSGE